MSPTTSNLRVLVLADDPLARAGLVALLANQPGCTVVGQIASQADITAELQVYLPEVIVWDMGWNNEAAIERLADLQDTGSPPVVALITDETYAADAWAAGARGLLLRTVDATTLVLAAMAVSQGLVVIAPELAAAGPSIKGRAPGSLPEELTRRELEVLQLLADGLANKTIAYRLSISEHTVKFHINAIMGKLAAQSRTEAVVRAARLGLIVL